MARFSAALSSVLPSPTAPCSVTLTTAAPWTHAGAARKVAANNAPTQEEPFIDRPWFVPARDDPYGGPCPVGLPLTPRAAYQTARWHQSICMTRRRTVN